MKRGVSMNRKMIYPLAIVFLTGALIISTGCSEPLSKREQGGLIGGGIGAGTGAIIGSTVGHAAVGALIGGPVGLIAGALIGDQLMGREKKQEAQAVQSNENQREIDRPRRENERLSHQRANNRIHHKNPSCV